MNISNISTGKIILFLLIFLFLTINLSWWIYHNTHVNKLIKTFNERISEGNENYIDAKNNLALNILLTKYKIDTSLILNNQNKSIIGNNIDNKIVILFKKDLCNICETNLFKHLEEYSSKNKVSDIIVLVPVNSYKSFNNYNSEHQLGFTNILAFKDEILKVEDTFGINSFLFRINEKFEISDLLIPNSLTYDEFEKFMQIIQKKTFN